VDILASSLEKLGKPNGFADVVGFCGMRVSGGLFVVIGLVLAVSAFITTANVPPDSSPILAAGPALFVLGVVLRAENQN